MRNVSLGIQALCRWFTFLLIIPVVVASQARAQNQDLTFSLGGIPDQTALYQQSAQLSNGRNTSSKFLNRGAFDFGGGLDYRLFRFLGLRGEVRDFFSGSPNLNVALFSSTQHNIVPSGGIVVNF